MNKRLYGLQTARDIMPARAVTQGEAYVLAERQATSLLRKDRMSNAPVDVYAIVEATNVRVEVEPRHKMPFLAGLAHRFEQGHWLITVNKNDALGRRRFTLAHEFKHVLDHSVARVAYARLGQGDPDKHDRQIEQICDHFAACLLMPRMTVKRAWFSGLQDIETLAELFQVSVAAMTIRLSYLGFIPEEDRPVRTYFRSAGQQLAALWQAEPERCPL